jgi:hypothetical protein
MEILKIIPQAFFDLIARVIPGAVAIVAYLWLFDKTWEASVTYIMGQAIGKAGAGVSIFVFLGSAFVMGELLSPAAKLVQRFGELKLFKPKEKEKGSYDYLRLKHPYAGSICAKIRAEFTMHNGLAVVFALSAAWYPFSMVRGRWYVFCILIFIAVIEAIRGRTTRDTFNETVRKFDKAARSETSAS